MVITTTLINLRTPSPWAMIPMISSTSDIMTMVASNALNASNKYIKLLANVLSTISVKKHVKNTKSI